MTTRAGVPAEFFHQVYDGAAPWDVKRAQPAVVALAESGLFAGDVLDVGTGTGDNAIYLAQRGVSVTAIDFVPKALEIARQRAADAGAHVDFQVHDALDLASLDRQFDVVLDSAVLHVFNDADQQRLVAGFKQVTKPGGLLVLLCFSDATPPFDEGPRQLSEQEVRTAFADGWTIRRLEPTAFQIALGAGSWPAWLLVAERKA